MTLQQQIRDRHLTARKAQDAFTLGELSLVLSEITNREKGTTRTEITDEVITAILKKRIEGHRELIAVKQGANRDTTPEENAIALLQGFLPAELSREELEAIVLEITGGPKDIKQMKQVSAQLKDRGLAFDNRMLAEILKGG